ncbi:hypothetical protein L3Q82_025294 [Scortum barcoo]|uniref:Uncharacterized protein n=1 Tax=Scortum barcoo TaxID=214431 RepID=A0ACB8WR72_9TELE|nr:hypothetical protein L3Q82_025294 [Scortum barcoo]
MPPGRLPREVFQACPTGRRPSGKTQDTLERLCLSDWPGNASGIPPEELEEVSGCEESVKKDELRQLLVERLWERGLFADESTAEVAGKANMEIRDPVPPITPAPKDPPVSPGMSAEKLQLTLRIKGLEVRNRELEAMNLRALELERQPRVTPQSPVTQSLHSPRESFDVSKHIALVPPFRESEVDSYFNAFERIAATLSWPKDVWPLLLQCKLVGKAQEIRKNLRP